MKIDIVTLFPAMFNGPLNESIIKRAREKNLVEINLTNIRDFTTDNYKTADDYPYSGGAGMIMKCEPVFKAMDTLLQNTASKPRIIVPTPRGKLFNYNIAKELSKEKRIIFICGHYEGMDERIFKKWATDEISIGDYVLTGGELAALVIIDSIIRLIPGAIGNEKCIDDDSFFSGLLEHPQYTRPKVYDGMEVPDVLTKGNHKKIELWKKEESLKLTKNRRPDLIKNEYTQ